jgi:hypothetical protein
MQLKARTFKRLHAVPAGAANQAAHLVTVRSQPGREHATDKSSGTGDENAAAHAAASTAP